MAARRWQEARTTLLRGAQLTLLLAGRTTSRQRVAVLVLGRPIAMAPGAGATASRLVETSDIAERNRVDEKASQVLALAIILGGTNELDSDFHTRSIAADWCICWWTFLGFNIASHTVFRLGKLGCFFDPAGHIGSPVGALARIAAMGGRNSWVSVLRWAGRLSARWEALFRKAAFRLSNMFQLRTPYARGRLGAVSAWGCYEEAEPESGASIFGTPSALPQTGWLSWHLRKITYLRLNLIELGRQKGGDLEY